MSPNPSPNVPAATDTTIADATQAAQSKPKLTEEQAKAVQQWAFGIRHAMTKHNTPFDGRKRNKKVAKAKNKRKANKKRKLYIRDGKR
jgi:hypothetical protein